MDQELVSFVLRFVREASEEQQARWRGVVKHVQSNNEASFSQMSEALAFMQGYINDIAQSSFEESKRMGQEFTQVNPLAETARMWGDLMPRYTQMMMDSMDQAMASSADMAKPVEEMMDSTLSAWGMPTRSAQAEQKKTAAAMEAMVAQLAALNEKIDALEDQIAELKKEKQG